MENQRRREECERKARRGEMDPRLEFTFQLLMDGTGLPRHMIMDYIFEGNMVKYRFILSCWSFLGFHLNSSWTKSINYFCRICETNCCGSTRRWTNPNRRPPPNQSPDLRGQECPPFPKHPKVLR